MEGSRSIGGGVGATRRVGVIRGGGAEGRDGSAAGPEAAAGMRGGERERQRRGRHDESRGGDALADVSVPPESERERPFVG